MGAYHAQSIKGTHLYSSSAWVMALDRQTPFDTRRSLKSRQNVAKVDVHPVTCRKYVPGGADLKKTQAYTREFGWAVADAFFASPQILLDLPELSRTPLLPADVWADAGLEDVLP